MIVGRRLERLQARREALEVNPSYIAHMASVPVESVVGVEAGESVDPDHVDRIDAALSLLEEKARR